MSATVLSSHSRVNYHSIPWAEPSVLQLRSLANNHFLNFNALEGSHARNTTSPSNTMRLTGPPTTRRFGQLQVAEEVSILELDVHSHHARTQISSRSKGDVCVSRSVLDKVLSEMVIIVPCKDEELPVIRGVIAAIPSPCLVILVSNCKRAENSKNGEVDEYKQQVETVQTFGEWGRQILAVHQKDPAAAAAFRSSGMSELLDPTGGLIRNGKGEGMLLGIAIAAAFCPDRRYIGFVDADNFNASSVTEYCKAFAAGFAMSRPPEQEDTIVRLKWSSKPKIRNGKLEYVPEGRCSRVVNRWLNRLFAPDTLEEPNSNNPFITTGNAGEHAMTMALAKKLRMAAGYAIEPFHFVDLLVRGCLDDNASTYRVNGHSANQNATPSNRQLNKPVTIRQIRTLSPHYHRESDDEHIRNMWAAGLGCVYHGLAPYASQDDNIAQLCEDMQAYSVENHGIDEATGELPCPRVYPALEDMDIKGFREVLEESMGHGLFHAFGLTGSKEE